MIYDQTQKRFKKLVKSVLFIECLNVARVLKLVPSGSLFQAFITRSQKNNARTPVLRFLYTCSLY